MWSVGGSTPACTARTVLISPASPAVHFVWPICDFTEPSTVAPGSTPPPANTSVKVASSVRSPTTVPVPWASASPMLEAEMPAR